MVPTPSDDLKKIQEATVGECKQSSDGCAAIAAEMIAMDISNLVTEKHENIEEIKKAFVDKVKSVTTNKSKAHKAVMALIRAAKTATTIKKGPASGPEAPDHIRVVLPIVQGLPDSAKNVDIFAEPVGEDQPADVPQGAFKHSIRADKYRVVSHISGFDSHLKWVVRQTSGKDKVPLAVAGYKPQVSKNIQLAMKKQIPFCSNIPALPLEIAGLSDAVFAPQVFAHVENYSNVGISPYGMGEMRLLVNGQYILVRRLGTTTEWQKF